MFDKVKQLYELKKQADALKRELEKIEVTAEAEGGAVRIVVDGTQRVKEVAIAETLLAPAHKRKLEEAVKRGVSDAMAKCQREAASKLGGMAKGLGLPGL